MTKKHYIAIAAGFAAQRENLLEANNYLNGDARDAVFISILNCARMFADIAAQDNPNFDRARFLAACGF